jgi:uncharacterized membrane protein
MPGFSPKAIVIDGRGHMLGRLASIVAKLLLSGNKVSLALFFSYICISFVPVSELERRAEETKFGSDFFLFMTYLL